jgi:hypothetical protein
MGHLPTPPILFAVATPEAAESVEDPPLEDRTSRTRFFERWTRGLSRDRVVWAAIAVFALVRFVECAFGPVATYNDSITYRVGFLDFSVTSLTGNSVRPWGATLWMALWPTTRGLVLAQILLGVVAWSALALALAHAIERPGVRRGVVIAVLVLGCTAQVAGWDLAILSESVSISTGILTLAAGIAYVRRPDWLRASAFLVVALWFTMTRPNIIPTLLAWAVVLVVVAIVRRQLLPGLVVAGVLVLFAFYSYAYNVRTDHAWQVYGGRSRTTVAYAYPVSRNNPLAAEVISALRKSDAPRCMIPGSPRDVGPNGPTAWVTRTAKSCPGMDEWLTANWSRWWSRWLLQHPQQAMTILGTMLPGGLSAPVWTSVTAAVPQSVSTLYFPSIGIPQAAVVGRTYWTQPLLLWLAVAAALALVAWRRWRGSPWGVDLLLVATAAGALASVAVSVLIIQTSAAEMGRESAGVVMLMTASCVALVGVGLDRVTRARPDLEAALASDGTVADDDYADEAAAASGLPT